MSILRTGCELTVSNIADEKAIRNKMQHQPLSHLKD